MIPRILSIIAIGWLFSTSCDEKKEARVVQDEKLFYPAFTFVNQELQSIDSMAVALFQYRTREGITDTSMLEKTSFRLFVESIFSARMMADPGKHPYERRVFMDETIGRITISFDAQDPTALVRRMDMLLDPETEEIRSIYLEQSRQSGDTNFIQKVTWSAGQQLQAGTIEFTPNTTTESRTLIVWGRLP